MYPLSISYTLSHKSSISFLDKKIKNTQSYNDTVEIKQFYIVNCHGLINHKLDLISFEYIATVLTDASNYNVVIKMFDVEGREMKSIFSGYSYEIRESDNQINYSANLIIKDDFENNNILLYSFF